RSCGTGSTPTPHGPKGSGRARLTRPHAGNPARTSQRSRPATAGRTARPRPARERRNRPRERRTKSSPTMATSPAPAESPDVPESRERGRAAPGRRISRWVIRMLLLAVAMLALATPAFAATRATHQAQAPHHTQAPHHARSVHNDGTETVAATPATLTANLTPAAPGGVCQVPGIGDIGGLIGLCNQGSAGIVGNLNNICQPSLPQPEQATGGLNAMVQPPGAPGVGTVGGKTLYDNYGVAGQFWAAHGLQCSDMTSLIGNNVAGMVFDAAKSVDRVTITVYQSAAGNDILTWLQDAVDQLITALGNAIYFPYLAPVVIL